MTNGTPDVVAIAAVARNGVIGVNNDLPWRLKGDLPRFKRLTLGQVLIMGRKTWDSIGRPLPGRTTIVISRDRRWREGSIVVPSVDQAFAKAHEVAPQASVVIAGGGEIYRAAWDRIDRLEITEVHQAPEGDVTFPAIDLQEWQETAREKRDGYDWVTYVRRSRSE